MLTIKRANFLVIILIVISIMQVGVMAGYNVATAPQTRTIEITAQKFRFDPGTITVNKGDTVILKIKSLDVTHGFYIDGYEIQKVIPAMLTTTITFKADTVGKFTFRCAETCGNFHPYMIGELRVQPNVVFYAGIAIVGILALTMVGKAYIQSKNMAKKMDEQVDKALGVN